MSDESPREVLLVWATGGMYEAECRACEMRCRSRARRMTAAVGNLPCNGVGGVEKTIRAFEREEGR